ncbi:MAG TPA: hypothetical protein VFS40_10220 [Gemmatimonadales bacterium]|nr:hypothetical protein [Gemmatimonadales bacterium]
MTSAHGAVVVVHDEVRWHAATRTLPELFAALGAYVAEQAPLRLWPQDADRVARWLERGDPEKAVLSYFAAERWRWDPERLHLVGPDEPEAGRSDESRAEASQTEVAAQLRAALEHLARDPVVFMHPPDAGCAECDEVRRLGSEGSRSSSTAERK